MGKIFYICKNSDRWYDIRSSIESLMESLDCVQPENAEIFSAISGFRTRLTEMETFANERLIKALEEEREEK